MKIIDMTCPKCGAPLNPDLDKGKAVCEYCGYHMLIEKEDSIEEIRAKAQSRAYGYHKGRLQAKAEAKAKKKKNSGVKITEVTIGVLMLLSLISKAGQELEPPVLIHINPNNFMAIEI